MWTPLMYANKTNYCHLSGGFVVAMLGILSLAGGWHVLISTLVIVAINLYVLLIFIECGLRSSDSSCDSPKPKKLIELPDRFWGPIQLFYLFIGGVSAFGNLYIHTGAVEHLVSDKPFPVSKRALDDFDEHATVPEKEYLTDKVDAFYFSLVTFTTLGYGDFVPANRTARCFVIWELVTTAEIILFAFPLVVSRIGDY